MLITSSSALNAPRTAATTGSPIVGRRAPTRMLSQIQHQSRQNFSSQWEARR